MHKKPKTITILGQRVTIEYTKDHPAENVHALFDPDNLKIMIHDTVKYDRFLIHEICHAALYVSGISNLLDEKLEEAICVAIEHSFFGIYELK